MDYLRDQSNASKEILKVNQRPPNYYNFYSNPMNTKPSDIGTVIFWTLFVSSFRRKKARFGRHFVKTIRKLDFLCPVFKW
jgi:hypothetical protein